MAAFPATILDETEVRAVRVVALALLADAAAHRERLSQPDDPEALHDFRVAVRRLRSWLRVHADMLGRAAPKRAQKWLARLAEATNHGRDAEVLIGWLEDEKTVLTARQRVGAAWLVRTLREEKATAEQEVHAEVARDFERARELLEERLVTYRVRMHVHEGSREATFAAAMSVLVRSLASTLRRRLDGVRTVHDDEAAHRARIAGKRLRYVLEPIVPHVVEGQATLSRLKQLQDIARRFPRRARLARGGGVGGGACDARRGGRIACRCAARLKEESRHVRTGGARGQDWWRSTRTCRSARRRRMARSHATGAATR